MHKKFFVLLDPKANEGGGGKPDQTDIVAQNAQLTKDLQAARDENATLKGQVATLTGERDAARTERDSAKSEVVTLKTEKATLTTERDAARTERDDWKAKAEPVQKQVATQLAAKIVELGIVDNKGKSGEKAGETVKLTATQKVLKAKGLPLDTKISIGIVGGQVQTQTETQSDE